MRDEKILAEELAWNLMAPCGDCPFRKDSPFHEGIAATAEAKFCDIQRGRFAHTCHKTDNRPECDGPHNWKGRPEHCAGAILMLLKTGDGYDLQLPLLQAIEAGKLDIEAMMRRAKRAKNVFTLPEFLRFQLEGAKQLLAKRRQRG